MAGIKSPPAETDAKCKLQALPRCTGPGERGNEPTEEDRGTYCTDLFQGEAVRLLKAHRERSFFLYLLFNASHNA